jgi:hypothetical protein
MTRPESDNASVGSTDEESDTALPALISGIAQIGHFPGPGSRTCGCIEQVHTSVGLAAGEFSETAASIAGNNSVIDANMPKMDLMMRVFIDVLILGESRAAAPHSLSEDVHFLAGLSGFVPTSALKGPLPADAQPLAQE